MTKALSTWRRVAFALMCAVISIPPALAQTAQEGKNLGALAAENLKKPRPPAPVDLTGTYVFSPMDASNGSPFTAFEFLPIPKLTPAAQAQMDKYNDYLKKGFEYRDDPGACWPLGMPRIMTRYWPIEIIQLPTEVLLISMFENNLRQIYIDGRKHPSDDDIVYSFNGHSIGHWEGKTLVVDTIGLTDDHHWVQEGVPTGTKMHIVERISKTDKGIEDEFTMTDPDNWVGEWKSLKHYIRDDHADVEEHACIYEQMAKLPTFKKNIRE